MKIQKIMRGMALAAVMALIATTAVAQPVTVSQIPGYHANDGEFNVTPIIGAGYDSSVVVGNGFETFCVSRTASLSILPGQYFGSVDINGIHQPENVVITKGMAWLYSQFAAGTLGGYNYIDTAGSGRTDSAYQLQLAIWILEGQYPITSIVDGSDPFLNEAVAFFGGGAAGLAAAMSPNTPGDYNVGVLNLNVLNADGSIGIVAQPVLVLLAPPPCSANICGNIFADCDGSGDLTAGDAGLPGVPVKLVDSTGKTVGSVNTDKNGTYCFGNLSAGTYTVAVTPPAGYQQTAASTSYHWKDGYARDCWMENDGNIHCINSGTECWIDKNGCLNWKDSYGRNCWTDKYKNTHCQPCSYKSCNATINNNTITVTLTNCQNQLNVNFSYTGTKSSLSVCVTGPSSVKCGQTVTYTCTVINTGNACFKGGPVCHTIGNCSWWGWQGNCSTFTSTCPPLSPGQSCVLQQKCTPGKGNIGTFGCQSTITCSNPTGWNGWGQGGNGSFQSSCTTQVTY